MNLENLGKILEGEPRFRYAQAEKAIFGDLIETWDEATTLSKPLREKLKQNCPLDITAELFLSKDGNTIKALITLADGKKIETVLMKHKDRNTICVSSQVGCPMGCVFCATGTMGFKRNLTKMEIVDQVVLFARCLKKTQEKITNLVFMGMGEPFLNYENVLGAIKYLHQAETLNLGVRRFSISTCGVFEGIKKLAKEGLEINLAISLHASNNELRSKLMPINRRYPLNKLMNVVKNLFRRN